MFVLNKKTKNVQECHNMDAIKACMKDAETYAVAEKLEDLVEGSDPKVKKEKADKSTAKTEKTHKSAEKPAKPVDKTVGDENGDDGKQVPDKENGEDGTNGPDEMELTGMELAELRKKAEELGISGCGNMNRETLVAMILNH